jgi:hypothetical protein
MNRSSVSIKKTLSRLGPLVALAMAVMASRQDAVAGQATVVLGSAGNFAVLAGSAVTSTGGTIVTGGLGVWAGTAVTGFAGFPPGGAGVVNGTIDAGDAVAQAAEGDLTTAYNDAAGRTLAPVDVSDADLGGRTLAPGLYKSTGTLAITGNLTLDASGDPNAVFIFQVASSLNTASGSQVILSGGANAANIFWQVGSSATLGTTTVFKGTIMANQSISLATGATLDGRALARIAAVTLDSNIITQPSSHSWNLWWEHSGGWLSIWHMSGTNRTSSAYLQPSRLTPGWRVAATPHLAGDSTEDLLFQGTDGRLSVWYMLDNNRLSGSVLAQGPVNPAWRIMASADLQGSGQKDFYWENKDGTLAFWFMDGTNFLGSGYLTPRQVDPAWKIVGTGDFNGDGQKDLLWEKADGSLSVWFMNGTNHLGGGFLNPSHVNPSWRVVATADINGDGQTHIIWQNTNGALAYWLMNGTNAVSSGALNPSSVDPAWRIVGPR